MFFFLSHFFNRLIVLNPTGSPKIMVSKVQIQIQSQTEMKAENELKEQEKKSQLDYKVEDSPIEWDANINFDSQYEIKSEIARYFSVFASLENFVKMKLNNIRLNLIFFCILF